MAELISSTKKSKRPFVFVAVGIVNTLTDFLFFTFLTLTFFKDNSEIAVAGLLSGTFALFFAFLMHSLVTWRGAAISHKTFLRFFLFTGFGMWAIRPLLLAFFIHFNAVYEFADRLSHSLGLRLDYDFIANTGAFGFMAVVLLVYNYFVYEKFVFTSK